MASTVAVPPVEVARWSASDRRCFSAPTTRPRTRPASRKRTSALAGMDIDVDLARVAFDEQRDDSVAVGGQKIHIGRPNRAGEDLVAHRPAVDENRLRERVRPAEGRQPDPPGEPNPVARRFEGERIFDEVVAERLPQPLAAAGFSRSASRPFEGSADVGYKGEPGVGAAEREPLHHVGGREGFAPVGFQELEPGRGGGEQVARLDPRADRTAARLDRAFRPVLDHQFKGGRRALGPGADLEPRHRGDRGQGLAAKAEGGDRRQVPFGDFRGRMPFDRKREVGLVHASPVVGDADEAPSAGLDRDLDRRRAGVERILDQLLDRRGRPLDHLAGGDAVDEQRIETANRHGREGP